MNEYIILFISGILIIGFLCYLLTQNRIITILTKNNNLSEKVIDALIKIATEMKIIDVQFNS